MFHTVFLPVSGIAWKMDLDLREWITWIFFWISFGVLSGLFSRILYVSSEDYIIF